MLFEHIRNHSITGGLVTKLTLWSRVLLEKLIVIHLVKKFPAFYGTHNFLTVFTRAHHRSLS
jgi:hypothetical protein